VDHVVRLGLVVFTLSPTIPKRLIFATITVRKEVPYCSTCCAEKWSSKCVLMLYPLLDKPATNCVSVAGQFCLFDDLSI
jgi:hypothetical protein